MTDQPITTSTAQRFSAGAFLLGATLNTYPRGFEGSSGASRTSWQNGGIVAYHDVVEQKFRELATQWRNETIGTSSPSRKFMNPNYLKVLILGRTVVPLILRELAERPDDWFMLLGLLTDENPVRPEDRKNFRRAMESWLEWGRQQHYL